MEDVYSKQILQVRIEIKENPRCHMTQKSGQVS